MGFMSTCLSSVSPHFQCSCVQEKRAFRTTDLNYEVGSRRAHQLISKTFKLINVLFNGKMINQQGRRPYFEVDTITLINKSDREPYSV